MTEAQAWRDYARRIDAGKRDFCEEVLRDEEMTEKFWKRLAVYGTTTGYLFNDPGDRAAAVFAALWLALDAEAEPVAAPVGPEGAQNG